MPVPYTTQECAARHGVIVWSLLELLRSTMCRCVASLQQHIKMDMKPKWTEKNFIVVQCELDICLWCSNWHHS